MYFISQRFASLGRYDILVYSLVLLVIPAITMSENHAIFGQASEPVLEEFPVPKESHPHDVAPDPAKDGPVWYSAQGTGELGKLDPKTGDINHLQLGNKSGPHAGGSAPHGIIIGPDGGLWMTDEFLKGIVRVDPKTEEIKVFPLPANISNNKLNTATFDKKGVLWFTDRSGYYGKLDPAVGKIQVWAAPRGEGPYGITTTPNGSVYFVSWTGNYTARIDLETGNLTILESPTKDSMPRRIWSDSKGNLWIAQWAKGNLAKYDPAADKWQEWKLPGDEPKPYAVFVDEKDMVWVSDFGIQDDTQSMVRFDPQTEKFEVFPLPSDHSNVRQINGRPGEVWGAQSGLDKLIVIRTGD